MKYIALQVATEDGRWLTFRSFPSSIVGFKAAVARQKWWRKHVPESKYRLSSYNTEEV